MNKQIIILLFVSITLAACGSRSSAKTSDGFDTPLSNQVEIHEDTDHEGHDHVHVDKSQATVETQVILVPSELVVGRNRFAIALIDATGRMLHDASVHFHYFDLSDPDTPILESETDAVPVQTPDGLTTIFAHDREFADAGDWGVEVQARFPDGTVALERIGFQVLPASLSLVPGDKVPAVNTLTTAKVNDDIHQLTSAVEPNPAFYELSLAEAVANKKPTVLLFATPAFCQTRVCGPVYEVASKLQQRYGEAVDFVHVEVFTGLPNPSANNWELAPAMTAFGLSTEPWVFIIDNEGTIVYRLEGVFTEPEIERHFRTLLGL